MPRNSKCRRVCAEPVHHIFVPERSSGQVTLTVEELEAMRLCDLEGLDQDEAAKRMDVSRGTLQRILYSARKCTVQALVEGKEIIISGGNYRVAGEPCQCRKNCNHCRFHLNKIKELESDE